MRIQLMSDLHLEFERDDGESFVRGLPVIGDILVLAGDVLPLRSSDAVQRTFGWFCDRFKEVVFVPGNHEYYGTRPLEADVLLAYCTKDFSNLHVLNPGTATIGGIRFIGAPLWFARSPDEHIYRRALNDFTTIKSFVPWVHETHATHLEFLRTNIQDGDVVITHHLPHPRSVAPRHLGSPLNRFFLADDAAELVEGRGARLWIHGHTHDRCDYEARRTRVLCNPRGYYPDGLQPDFDSGLAVDL